MRLLGADGKRLSVAMQDPHDPSQLEEAGRRMAQQLTEALYGNAPEDRVRKLRASVLHEPEPGPTLTGLAAWLP